MAFQDHFSEVAAGYARFRPSYPDALFAWLSHLSPRRERAWDCGAGSGQASAGLARHFDVVIATDPSEAQLRGAAGARASDATAPDPREPPEAIRTKPRWHRAACTAERSCLADRSVDLVTVAQALHWFDAASFWREARRVARADGLVAAWSYDVCRVDAAVDPVLERLYRVTLADHWSPERRHVEAGYRTLPFPFDELAGHPPLAMERDLDREAFVGYVETWSAVRAARRAGADPMPAFRVDLARAWPEEREERTVRWPLALRVGRMG